jgi:hypothetical protein
MVSKLFRAVINFINGYNKWRSINKTYIKYGDMLLLVWNDTLNYLERRTYGGKHQVLNQLIYILALLISLPIVFLFLAIIVCTSFLLYLVRYNHFKKEYILDVMKNDESNYYRY